MLNIQEVYEQYFTIVYRYLLSLSHNTHIAEELTQETFFKALKKVDDFRGDCDLRVWLCYISRNTYYDYLKKNKKSVQYFVNLKCSIFIRKVLKQILRKSILCFFLKFRCILFILLQIVIICVPGYLTKPYSQVTVASEIVDFFQGL